MSGTNRVPYIHIGSNSALAHPAGQAGLNVIASDLVIDAGGAIDVSGLGYPSDTGPGAGSIAKKNYGGGGGYGGAGGNGQGAGGVGGATYGVACRPVDLGSGGSSSGSSYGGAGGGAVHVIAEHLLLNGTIRANGTQQAAGGGGGSVWVAAQVLEGQGDIAAKGGGCLVGGGGGGGGRIAVQYGRLVDFDLARITAPGGVGYQDGQPGTIRLYSWPAADFDGDTDVDLVDLAMLEACMTGPAIDYRLEPERPGCVLKPGSDGFLSADFDRDGDIDQSDFGVFQRCYGGADMPVALGCAE